MARPIGMPEPFIVATKDRVPCVSRVRMFARRAWNVPQSEHEEISR